MTNYSSLLEAINDLRKRGYTEDFKLQWKGLDCSNGQCDILYDEFTIDEYHRFEENTDPEEQSIIYAISSDKYKLKGILINSYGLYADAITNEMIAKMAINPLHK